MNKVQMRSRDKETRVNNFSEVNLGYNKEEAKKEANRCLNCQNPRCVKGCPIGIQIPKLIEAYSKSTRLNSSHITVSRMPSSA